MKKWLKSLICLEIIIFTFILSINSFALSTAPSTRAQSVLVVNLQTGEEVYKKNADAKIYPASVTKVMTLILSLESISDLNEVLTIDKDRCYEDLVIGSSNMALKDGEKIKIHDLLYGIALSSANEAANALAIRVSGSIEDFVKKMNDKAKSLGMKNTHFVNAHGLHDDNHYTTASDLAKLCKYALKNQTFKEIVSTSAYRIAKTNKTLEERVLHTTNALLTSYSPYYYKYAKGIKTGTTTMAGYNLVSYAEYDNVSFLCITMNAPKGDFNPVFEDSRELFRWSFKNFVSRKLVDKSDLICEVEVELSASENHLVLVPKHSLSNVISKDIDIETIEKEVKTNEKILAPIKQGDVLGTLTLKKNGVNYGTVNLVASEDISRSTVLYILYCIENFFKNIYVRLLGLALLIFIIIYIIIMISNNRNRRKKKAVLINRIKF